MSARGTRANNRNNRNADGQGAGDQNGGFQDDRYQHLDVITDKDGIAARFKEMCPAHVDQITDWIKRIRAAIRGARSGIKWSESRVLTHGAQPVDIDLVVPLTVVFDFPTPEAVSIPVPVAGPVGGIVQVCPPLDVLIQLSSQIYSTILPLIQYKNRHLHEGVPEDDGWQLLRRIREAQAEEGTMFDSLQAKRDALSCNSFSDYPTFKATVQQLKSDWDHAIANGLIDSDCGWSVRRCNEFVAELLQPLLGVELLDFVNAPGNEAIVLTDTLKKATALYRVRVRNLRKRKSATDATSLLAAHDEVHEDVDGVDSFYSHAAPAGRFSGSGRRGRRDPAGFQQRNKRHQASHPNLGWMMPFMAAMMQQQQWTPPLPQGPAPLPSPHLPPGRYGKGKGQGKGRGKGNGHQFGGQQLSYPSSGKGVRQYIVNCTDEHEDWRSCDAEAAPVDDGFGTDGFGNGDY